jgi:hypothetical protein
MAVDLQDFAKWLLATADQLWTNAALLAFGEISTTGLLFR